MNRGALSQFVDRPQLVAPPGAAQCPGPDLSERDIDIVAHHEASHCLAYLTYNLRFRRAVIFIGDHGAVEGAVRVGVTANGDYGSTRRAVIYLSGACGEARYLQANVHDVLANGAVRTDVEMAMAALECDPRSPPFDVVLAAAQRLVETQWLRIERLAAELVRHHELDYDTCRAIVARR